MTQQNEIMPITLGQLFPAAELPKPVAAIVAGGLSMDSRNIENSSIFIAIQGANTHGKYYIDYAISQGAVAILMQASDEQYCVKWNKETPIIYIPSLEESLSEIAGCFYGHPTKALPLLAITGTNGKTTCSQLYGQLSALLGQCSGIVGTLGYGSYALKPGAIKETQISLTSTGMTTPDAITIQSICAQLLNAGNTHLVMEVSSHGLEQGRVRALDIDTAIFTNLSHDHLDYHDNMIAYGAAKAKLFVVPSLSSAIINLDDPFSKELLKKVNRNTKIITYSVNNPAATLFLSNIEHRSSLTHGVLHTPESSYPFSVSLLGRFNLSNLLAVWAAFYIGDIAFASVVQQSQYLSAIPGRMEVIPNNLDKQVIIDYAHTPDALKNVLETIREYTHKKIWCIFGCGGNRDQEKRAIMAGIAETYADRVVVTNDNPRNEDPQSIVDDIIAGFSGDNFQIILDREQAITQILQQSSVGDVVLIAGKGHEDYQLVGDQKFPFSDQQVARLAMRNMEVSD